MSDHHDDPDAVPPNWPSPQPHLAVGWPLHEVQADPDSVTGERRMAPRSVTLEYQSLLGWWEKGEFQVMAARLLDLSLGGAALETVDPPPEDRDVWFCLVPGQERDCLSGEVVAINRSVTGRHLVRLAFWTPCPGRLLNAAIHGVVDREPRENPPNTP